MNAVDQLIDSVVAPPAALFAGAVKFAWQYHFFTILFAVVFWVGASKAINHYTNGENRSREER